MTQDIVSCVHLACGFVLQFMENRIRTELGFCYRKVKFVFTIFLSQNKTKQIGKAILVLKDRSVVIDEITHGSKNFFALGASLFNKCLLR